MKFSGVPGFPASPPSDPAHAGGVSVASLLRLPSTQPVAGPLQPGDRLVSARLPARRSRAPPSCPCGGGQERHRDARKQQSTPFLLRTTVQKAGSGAPGLPEQPRFRPAFLGKLQCGRPVLLHGVIAALVLPDSGGSPFEPTKLAQAEQGQARHGLPTMRRGYSQNIPPARGRHVARRLRVPAARRSTPAWMGAGHQGMPALPYISENWYCPCSCTRSTSLASRCGGAFWSCSPTVSGPLVRLRT